MRTRKKSLTTPGQLIRFYLLPDDEEPCEGRIHAHYMNPHRMAQLLNQWRRMGEVDRGEAEMADKYIQIYSELASASESSAVLAEAIKIYWHGV